MKGILLVLLLFASVLLVGCTSGNVDKTPPVQEQTTTATISPMQTPKPTATPRVEPTPEAKVELKIGESADNGEKKVTVKSVQVNDVYIGSLGGHAKEGKTFVIVDLEVRNIGKSDFYTGSELFIIDSEGNKYDPELFNDLNDKFDFYAKLVPGTQKTGQVLFEIPADAAGLQIVYDFSGFFEKSKLAIWKIEGGTTN